MDEEFGQPLTIVIHPGSRFLRIGLNYDSKPKKILHVIARRRTAGGRSHRDSFLVPEHPMSSATQQAFEETVIGVTALLKNTTNSKGVNRRCTKRKSVSSANHHRSLHHANPKYCKGVPHWETYDPPFNQDMVLGQQIPHLTPTALREFNIHFPISRGDLHLHSEPGGSLTSVAADLRDIWTAAIQEIIGPNQKFDPKTARFVLVIPDIFCRRNVRTMVQVLAEIGCSSFFLIQDHVAATFGAGLASACVVDCGDQKTSISCVEDGISIPSTRLRVGFGGADMTLGFYHILQRQSGFPLKDLSGSYPWEADLLTRIKEDWTTADPDTEGERVMQLQFPQPSNRTSFMDFTVGDECIVGGLQALNPAIFGCTGAKHVVRYTEGPSEPEDPFDAQYLKDTGRRWWGAPKDDDSATELDVPMEAQRSCAHASESSSTASFPSVPSLSLDCLILTSIEGCPSSDIKRRMYGSILLVGDGLKFQSISGWIRSRVAMLTPPEYRSPDAFPDVVSRLRTGVDAGDAVWRGAALLSTLESSSQLWIPMEDWRKYSVRILRERCPFTW